MAINTVLVHVDDAPEAEATTKPGLIMALNVGSSGLKFTASDSDQDLRRRLHGEVVHVPAASRLRVWDAGGELKTERTWRAGTPDPIAHILQTILEAADDVAAGELAGVGHRVVHGGAHHIAPERVTAALLRDLDALTPLDPLHMPAALNAMKMIALARPTLIQVACFDTAFHQTMPPVATRFALPRELEDAGVRRYGFHGLSYEFIAAALTRTAPALAAGRVVVAHLGSGASLCAMHAGKSVATTMGYTPMDGLVMATRVGSVDPGVIFQLGRQGRSLAEIEIMMLCRSGLLGVSGISGDVRDLLYSDDPRAKEALDLFTYRIACETGAMASAMGGVDGLVFTGGIGEASAPIRAAVCERLGWLGVRLDPAANASGAARISAPDSPVQALVLATDEEEMITRHTRAKLDEVCASPRAA